MRNRRGSAGQLSNLDQLSAIEPKADKGNCRLKEMETKKHTNGQTAVLASIRAKNSLALPVRVTRKLKTLI